jgi:chromosome segregation ATPase
MTLAMFIVGLLFGIALTLTLGFFAVLSTTGPFDENLRAVAAAIRGRLTGGHRKGQATAPTRSVEQDAKVRALQEEVRVMQRLMDKERVERQVHKDELQSATAEVAALRTRITERDERLAGLEATIQEKIGEAGKLRDELAERCAELASARQQVKDLETEINVMQSGAGLSAVSDEIARLRAERDELTARLARLTKPVTVSK